MQKGFEVILFYIGSRGVRSINIDEASLLISNFEKYSKISLIREFYRRNNDANIQK